MRHSYESGMVVREVNPAEGPGSGLGTILYVHGLGESGLSLAGIALRPELAGWRHLIPDLPGYGRSPWPDEPLPLESAMDHLAEWLDGRGERGPFVVLGHSMGGVAALLFAERHPELVRAIIDVEGNKSIKDCAFSSKAEAESFEDFEQGGFDRLRESVYRVGRDEPALRGYYASLRFADPRTYHLNSRELVAISSTETPARRLAALGIPVLYVPGVPKGAGPRSLELVRQAGLRVAVIEPAGHWPFLDQPDAFAGAVAAFLHDLSG